MSGFQVYKVFTFTEINEAATSSSVEYTDPTVSPIVDLVPPQGGVTVCFDPHASHRVIKYLVVLNEP